MRQSVILIGVCVLVLLGAWLGSRALLAGEEVVPPVAPVTPVVVAPTPAVVPAVVPPEPVREVAAVAAEVIDAGVAAAVVVPGPERPANPLTPLPDDATNPYRGESAELDYADSLLFENDGGIERLISARDVYRRCLEMEPELQRCKDGLEAAQMRIAPPRVNVLRKGPGLRATDFRKGFQ
ncbi:MAG: hypothetical protein U0228_02375 [Myxococcaceae bacterium]